MNLKEISTNEAVAVEILKCAIAWEPDARLVGNVRAADMARLAAACIDTCPKCGATAWVNIDCDLCLVCSSFEQAIPQPFNLVSDSKK